MARRTVLGQPRVDGEDTGEDAVHVKEARTGREP